MQAVEQEETAVSFDEEAIPTLPVVALQLLEAAMDENADASRIVKIIRNDPALTAKVLQAANSAQYGFRGEVTTVERAAALLGNNSVRAIALSVSFFQTFRGRMAPGDEFDPRDFWKHSIGCALLSESLGKRMGRKDLGVLFVGGLLHDIGRLALHLTDPQAYGRIIAESYHHSQSVMDEERSFFGADHTAFGSRLGTHWNLPVSTVDAIRLHHTPLTQFVVDSHKTPHPYEIVCLANVLVNRQWLNTQGYQVPTPVPSQIWEYFGLRPESEADLVRGLLGEVRQYAPVFETSLDFESLHVESLFRANRALANMSVELERRGRQIRLELKRASLAEILHTEFRPGLSVTETLESAVKSLCGGLRGARGIGLVWAIGESEALLTRCENYDSPIVTERVTLSEPLTRDPARESVALAFLKKTDPSFDEAAVYDAISQSRLKIVPFEDCRIIEGCFIADARSAKKPLESWAFEPVTDFFQRAAATLERAWLHEDLQGRIEELERANQLAETFRSQMGNAERLAAVGGMAAGVAHEINNPLSIIRGQAQLLLMREENPERADRLRIIDQQSHRISKVLTELMGFARPHSPGISRVNMAELLNRTLNMCKHQFKHRRIECIEEYDPKLPLIQADLDILQQLFLNLIINADHAMGKEGRLILRANPDQVNQGVLIEIEDTGCGIPRENLRRIFDPFFTTKEKGKGTGLGLFTSMSIVEGMAGELKVRSEVGQGTCFSIFLPLEKKAKGPASQPPLAERQPGAPSRILVIDDEEIIREILTEALTVSNYQVDTAGDGLEGLRKLSESKYDCVLLDLRMPFKTGVELMEWLRNPGRAEPAPPIIAITGISDVSEAEAAIRLGALACVKKPFSIETILKEIEGALAKNLVSAAR
jgi:signal transduction histidine kinase/HD-like signal output (HDOD) protein/CheY-like chemotaxis protein